MGYTSKFGGGACLWTPVEGKQDLNKLVVNLPEGVRLIHAMAINRQGEIAGYMATDGSGLANGVFKLTPIVVPLSPCSCLISRGARIGTGFADYRL